MAKLMMDISLDGDEDIDIENGDFVITESTAQHQRQLLLNGKGDFKQNPTIGTGVFQYFDDENFNDLIRAISIEFTRDGMDVQSIKVGQQGIVQSDAFYK